MQESREENAFKKRFSLRRYFWRYVEEKNFGTKSDSLSFEEFSRIDFDRDYPELLYDVLYYLARYRIWD